MCLLRDILDVIFVRWYFYVIFKYIEFNHLLITYFDFTIFATRNDKGIICIVSFHDSRENKTSTNLYNPVSFQNLMQTIWVAQMLLKQNIIVVD